MPAVRNVIGMIAPVSAVLVVCCYSCTKQHVAIQGLLGVVGCRWYSYLPVYMCDVDVDRLSWVLRCKGVSLSSIL